MRKQYSKQQTAVMTFSGVWKENLSETRNGELCFSRILRSDMVCSISVELSMHRRYRKQGCTSSIFEMLLVQLFDCIHALGVVLSHNHNLLGIRTWPTSPLKTVYFSKAALSNDALNHKIIHADFLLAHSHLQTITDANLRRHDWDTLPDKGYKLLLVCVWLCFRCDCTSVNRMMSM